MYKISLENLKTTSFNWFIIDVSIFSCKHFESVIHALYMFIDMYYYEDFWLIYCNLVLINMNMQIIEGATSATFCLLGVVGNRVSFLKLLILPSSPAFKKLIMYTDLSSNSTLLIIMSFSDKEGLNISVRHF